jgi:hypothetical protein
MTQFDNQDRKTISEKLRGTLFMLLFGVGMLMFLIAIDRPEWFNLRPISGAAAAMSQASDSTAGEKETEDTQIPGRLADVQAGAAAGDAN